MKFTIPTPLQQEHEALHDELRRATQAGGDVGEAASALAGLMQPHFVKEDQIALPPLGLLGALARGESPVEMAEVLMLTDRLQAELPAMLEEHKTILAALQRVQQAAERAGRSDIVAFAKQLVEHARTEEEVMYPAAVLVGHHVRLLLGQHADEQLPATTASPMKTPAFFDHAPSIVMYDALAQTLGATQDGLIEYRYLDAVKLAGHSCPTVACAWLMTRTALARLYPGQTPHRGEVRVALREPQDEGVTGVIASVAGLVTGAAGSGGFKGLAGRHGRRNLLVFGEPMRGEMRFTRLDNGEAVEVSHHPEAAPRPAELRAQMQAALGPQANSAQREAFTKTWQAWVRAMLIEHADDPALITVED